ncbi:unnamed protein product, partial [Didymodactylos carnosus]
MEKLLTVWFDAAAEKSKHSDVVYIIRRTIMDHVETFQDFSL